MGRGRRAVLLGASLALLSIAPSCGAGDSAGGPVDGGGTDGTVSPDGPLPDGATPDAGRDGAHGPDAGDAGHTGDTGGVHTDGESGVPPPSGPGVFTYHNDNARTGASTNETVLTLATVNQATFGKKFAQTIDGYVYAQPLVAPGVSVPGKGVHDIVYVVTEHDSVYAFDAGTQQAPIWQVSFLGPGVTTVPAADTGETGDLVPEIGITGTPVIDPAGGTLYLVAKTKEPGPTYVYRLHALDLATGAEKLGGPMVIQASVAGTGTDSMGGMIPFVSLTHLQRPALLLAGGVVYIAFGSHGDHNVWHGWVLGYDAGTLAQKYAYCTSPDADSSAIWQAGGGIAGDDGGNLYVETGNGPFDGDTGGRDLGMSVIKLSASATVADWFTPYNQAALSTSDVDLGSAGALVLPDQGGAHPHLVIATGKPGVLYLLDRDQMGHFHAGDNSQIVQSVDVMPNTTGVTSGIFATPAYWNGTVVLAAVQDNLKAFSLSAGQLSATPTSLSSHVYGYPGATPSISANGVSNGIVWVIEGDGYTPANPAVLHAYDATNLATELYASDQAAGARDTAGPAVKCAVPTVANGRVYVATQTELDVYGTIP